MSSEIKQIQMAMLNKLLDYSSLILAVLVLCWINQANNIPVDSGDGLAHFFIAQNVWNNPLELLSHWGKPLFTLLSSPFAYFGFKTYIGFNILVFALTSWLGIKITTRLNASRFVKVIFPFALLSVPDYASNILGGLTEPFFGLLLITVGYLLIQKKWLWVALIASLLPFSRSEGQFAAIVVGIILIAHKQWKFLPLLITTWLIYAFIGLLVFTDFFWYFTHNPYRGAAEIYGAGSWLHYLQSWQRHFGWMGLTILGVLLFLIPLKKHIVKFKSPAFLFIMFALVVYLGILLTHAYLWATGQNGALGLSRLATHGLPLFFLTCLLAIDFFISGNNLLLARIGVGFFILFISYKSIRQMGYPKNAGEFETELIDSAKYLNKIKDQTHKIYYYHPLIALNVNANLKDTSGVFHQKNFLAIDKEVKKWKGGEIIVRDAHFGPMEMGLTEENLGPLVRIRSFHAFTSAQTHLGENYRVDIYQYQPGTSTETKPTVIQKINNVLSLAKSDLYLPVEDLEGLSAKENEEILVEIDVVLTIEPSKPFYLVLQKKNESGSLTYEIKESRKISISLSPNHLESMILFVYNPNQVECKTFSIESKITLVELADFRANEFLIH